MGRLGPGARRGATALIGLLTVLASIAGPGRSPSVLAASSQGTGTGYDWTTYGFDNQRTGHNPLETALTAANAATLHLAWSAPVNGVAIDQALYASGVMIDGEPTDVVYVGSESGSFFAFSASDGTLIWKSDTGFRHTICTGDMANGNFGISGTAVMERSKNRIYFVGKAGVVYARNMATGATVTGWPVRITTDQNTEYVWSGMALSGGRLFVVTASYCDQNPYRGRVIEIDTTTHSIVDTWYVIGPTGVYGGGIYGYGGASLDAAGNVYVATDDSAGSNEHQGLAERTVKLNPSLDVVASNYPALPGLDTGQGSTPMLFQVPGAPANCPGLRAVVENKAGYLLLYDTSSIGSGAIQKLHITPTDPKFYQRLQGVTAFSPVTGLVYVGNPKGFGSFPHGLLAFASDASKAGCPLTLAWQATTNVGPAGAVSDPTVAAGVVYWGDGGGKHLHAYDAASGVELWNSGTTINGSLYAAPTVANGRVFVSSWNGGTPSASRIYAFEPDPLPAAG